MPPPTGTARPSPTDTDDERRRDAQPTHPAADDARRRRARGRELQDRLARRQRRGRRQRRPRRARRVGGVPARLPARRSRPPPAPGRHHHRGDRLHPGRRRQPVLLVDPPRHRRGRPRARHAGARRQHRRPRRPREPAGRGLHLAPRRRPHRGAVGHRRRCAQDRARPRHPGRVPRPRTRRQRGRPRPQRPPRRRRAGHPSPARTRAHRHRVRRRRPHDLLRRLPPRRLPRGDDRSGDHGAGRTASSPAATRPRRGARSSPITSGGRIRRRRSSPRRTSSRSAPPTHSTISTSTGAIAHVGFDDIELADIVEPGISVVPQQPRELGRRAAEQLFRRIHGDRSEPIRDIIESPVIARGSGEIRPAP